MRATIGYTATLLICCLASSLAAQNNNAPWIAYPSANNDVYGVYHFRKKITFQAKPATLVIHVSADNRYNLFVNGSRVAYGPAKGDLTTYKYDVVDIAPYLKQGDNVVAAQVHNAGKDKPLALLSAQTAFMLRPEDPAFKVLQTDSSWKSFLNKAHEPVSYYEMLFKERWFYGFYACGPGDRVDFSKFPWGWESPEFDDSKWLSAEVLHFEGKAPWNLVARNIAMMDNHTEHPARIRSSEHVTGVLGFAEGKTTLHVAANTKATVLFDYGYFTMGYPQLVVDKGRQSKVKIKYAEALYERVNVKAHRDSVRNLTMYGVWDEFVADGQRRMFRPLWKRAFRYVLLEIETGAEPLEVVSFVSEYSGYPYPEMATFVSSDSELNTIFDVCQRTLRMCSGETYYDTPYYEQLSYGGDNCPIGNNSMYNSTDDRLFKEVMRLYPQSENKETGLFKSAYPSRFDFDMGSWSMAWILSLHDYYFTRGDKEFVKQFVPKIEGVLNFYHRHLDESIGILGTIKSQNFMDWSIAKGSIPRSNENEEIIHSVMLTLFYTYALDCTGRLFDAIGAPDKATAWRKESARVKEAVKRVAWNDERKLFSDYPDQSSYSQHTNILAILTNLVPSAEQAAMLDRILTYREFDEYASSYFSFYLFRAMQQTGRGDLFLQHLGHWQSFLQRGLTTTGETGFPAHDRSDCHAWSAHPSYYMLSIVAGIEPASVGFDEVKIAPHLGNITSLKAMVPHPKGKIAVEYTVRNGKLRGVIVLPDGLTGKWEYNGVRKDLKPGVNKI